MVLKILASDWSGVVSDDRRPVYESNMRVLERYGKDRVPFDEWLRLSKASASELFVSRGVKEPRGLDYLERLYKDELDSVGRDGIVPTPYDDAFNAFLTLYEREIPITIISSHPEQNLRKEAQRYGLARFIKSMIGGSRDKTESILKVCEEMGVNPSEVLYVGDTIFDIKSGKKAGVRTGGISTGYHSRKRLESEEPDYLLDSLSELLNIFYRDFKLLVA